MAKQGVTVIQDWNESNSIPQNRHSFRSQRKNDKEVIQYDANGRRGQWHPLECKRIWSILEAIVPSTRDLCDQTGRREESEVYYNSTLLGTEKIKYYYSLNIGVEKTSPSQLLNEATFVLQTLRHFTPLTMADKSRSRPKGIPTATRATVSFFLEVGIDMI